MTKEIINNRIEELSDRQALTLGLTCFYRAKHFYEIFEKNNDLTIMVYSKMGKKNCLSYLEETLTQLGQTENLPSEFFIENLNLFELAIVDDDFFGSSVENFSAQLVAIIAADILEFGYTFDKDHIINCIGSVSEIINQNRSDLFYSLYPDKPLSELDDYLDEHFEIEYAIENSIINMIEEGISMSGLISFCDENTLTFE